MGRYFALIPAAGCGVRAQTSLPKQYVTLGKWPVLYYAMRALMNDSRIVQLFVLLGKEDTYFETLDWSAFENRLSPLWCGGTDRHETVANGLKAIRNLCEANDWILVHDGARPLLSPATLSRFLDEIGDDPVGGLLAVPVRDTMKAAFAENDATTENRVARTVDRTRLWHAQTPQMFRYHLLYNALMQDGDFSDESSAVEALGISPRLITGDHSNIKITYPEDIGAARALMAQFHGFSTTQA